MSDGDVNVMFLVTAITDIKEDGLGVVLSSHEE